jgi:hypothetical protein
VLPSARMLRGAALSLLLALLATPADAAGDRDALLRARQLYNQRDFASALIAADEARATPDLEDSADLIAARALLERYRESASPDDLTQARERLRRVRPDRFVGRERLEFIVGLGETLYFENSPGAAAGVFDSVLASPELLVEGRELVLDWWASAVDQEARPRSEFERHSLYEKVRTRMMAELARNPGSGTAAYWAAAAARGQGDFNSAWGAAQAGWVRAPLGTDRGAALRGDLDRLVHRAIIPERARALGQSPDTLREEWEQFKAKWSR